MSREYYTINFKPDVKAFVATNLANSGSFKDTGKPETSDNEIEDTVYVAGDNLGNEYYGPVKGSFYSDLSLYLISNTGGTSEINVIYQDPDTPSSEATNILINNLEDGGSVPYIQSGSYLQYYSNLLFYYPLWNHEIQTATLQTLEGNSESNIYLSTLVPTTCKIEGVIYENKAFNQEISPNIIFIPEDSEEYMYFTSLDYIGQNAGGTASNIPKRLILAPFLDTINISRNMNTGQLTVGLAAFLPLFVTPANSQGVFFNSLPTPQYWDFSYTNGYSTRITFSGVETIVVVEDTSTSALTPIELAQVIPPPDSVLNIQTYNFNVGDTIELKVSNPTISGETTFTGTVAEYNPINNTITLDFPPQPSSLTTPYPNTTLGGWSITITNLETTNTSNNPTLRNIVQFKASYTLIPKLNSEDDTFSIGTGNRIGGSDNGIYYESTLSEIEFNLTNNLLEGDIANYPSNFLGETFSPYSDFGANRSFGLSFDKVEPSILSPFTEPGKDDLEDIGGMDPNGEDIEKALHMFTLGGAFTPGKNTIIKGIYTIY